jgi:hypothetical protein
MGKKKNPQPEYTLVPSELLINLLEAGATNSVSFNGYIGPTVERDGKPAILFYPDIYDLTKHLVIFVKDILHAEPDPGSDPPFDAKIIWVNAKSDILVKKTEPPALKTTTEGVSVEAGGLQLIIGKTASAMIRNPICVHCT